MKEQNKVRPVVFVRCMTYNHEHYIEDAIKGFVMQETDFPFVVAVVDDASADNNVSVILDFVAKHCDCKSNYIDEEKDYGRVIQVHPSTNPNCLLHIVLLKENHFRKKSKRPYYAQYEDSAKYIAVCEGDDYWTDPYKLQKQVDFLEQHNECSLCFHGVKILNEITHTFQDDFLEDVPYSSSGVRLAKGNYIHAPSVMYRKNNDIEAQFRKLGRLSMGDHIQYLLYAQVGTIVKLPDIMAVYRMGMGRWSGSSDVFRKANTIVSLSKAIPLLTDAKVKSELDNKIDNYVKQIISEITKQERTIVSMRQSKAYRLGTFLLKPFKKVRALINKCVSFHNKYPKE